jgi:hypothetical protein
MSDTAAHRAKITNLARPAQLGASSSEISSMVRQVKELDDTVCVYARQWLMDSRHGSMDEAQAHILDNIAGRVAPDDVRTLSAGEQATVHTKVWTKIAEFTNESLAAQWAETYKGTAEELTIVQRSSRAEQTLLNYGKVKIKAKD